MDVYEATQALLTEVTPTANVTSFSLKYDEIMDQFELPDLPAVTYIYENLTPLVTHEGPTNLYRIALTVEAWGDLETASHNGEEIVTELSGKRITVENIIFTMVASEVRDVYEVGFDFHRRIIRFGGLIEIGEEYDSR